MTSKCLALRALKCSQASLRNIWPEQKTSRKRKETSHKERKSLAFHLVWNFLHLFGVRGFCRDVYHLQHIEAFHLLSVNMIWTRIFTWHWTAVSFWLYRFIVFVAASNWQSCQWHSKFSLLLWNWRTGDAWTNSETRYLARKAKYCTAAVVHGWGGGVTLLVVRVNQRSYRGWNHRSSNNTYLTRFSKAAQ